MNIIPYVIAILAAMFGLGSILVFTVFLYVGPFHIVVLPLHATQVLVFDAGLSVLFFMQHSLMVRVWFKQILARIIPKAYFGGIFSIISGIVLLMLIALWQESPTAVVSFSGEGRWLVRGLFFLVLIVQMWALWSIKSVDLFGIHVLIKGHNPTPQQDNTLLLVGAYRWVRHPIYFTTILLVWFYPDLTLDRLLLNVLFTSWIVVGAMLEERDLVAIYGETYRSYQRAVPMLIPYRKPAA